MLKLNTLMDMEDHQVHGSNDLRYEAGVAPSKFFASPDHGDETATHSVQVMDKPREETVTHHTALPDGCTTQGLLQPPRCHRFEYTDRWADSDKARIDARIRDLIALGYHGDPAKDLTRSRTVIDMSNPATQELGRTMPTIVEWFKLIPRAVALDIIYDPEKGRLFNGVVLDDEAVRWFKNIDDAIGIRSRAAVLRKLLQHEAANEGRLAVASLACGAAQPVLETMAGLLRDARSAESTVTLVDLDRESLEMAVGLASSHGIADRVTTATKNILGLQGIDIDPGSTDGRVGYDVVEALGFLEYLPPENQESYTYNGVVDEKRSRAGAIVFLKNAYDLVRPGGLLIFGNMLDETHKQLEFTLNTVQWPHIQPRSINQMLQIIAAAGIDDAAELDIYCPTDGVYAVYAIRKP
ncbi:SAM-dependent methyltransferase [Tessaracoccus antarcticus]|uniref:Class I SAM-dependent methyltransferase n=1 Tax=Tessaracoccus antarcticus TaxID=2479848 RepID=A0A3M0G5M7_9ACTN|nr:class I SAM-dependent methyltransferase [Tessaracoccus antarcticus]RMB59868.1 class I SAM-dependent methyltransferase [Tessaracoccus antarcticus]